MKNRLFLYTKAFSDLGNNMDFIALNALILLLTESPLYLSINLGLRMVGGALSSLIAGNLADRFNRKKLMLYSDLLRFICIILIIPFPTPEMVLFVSFMIGFTSSFFVVSYNASIPDIFGENKKLEVNALITRLGSISMIIGFIGSGIITQYLDYKIVIIVDALSYLLCIFVLLMMKWEQTSHNIGSKTNILEDMTEMFSYFKRNPTLIIIFTVFFMDMFAASALNVGIPLLAKMVDPSNDSFLYGLIWGMVGIGSVVASIWIAKAGIIKKHMNGSYLVSLFVATLFFTLIFSTENLLIILIFAVSAGVFQSVIGTVLPTIFQSTEYSIRGRIFGFNTFLRSLAFTIGFIITPYLIKIMGVYPMVIVQQGLVILSTVIGFLMFLYLNHKKELTIGSK